MDDGKGKFKKLDSTKDFVPDNPPPQLTPADVAQLKSGQGVFREREILVIRGSRFRINSIHSNGKMILKLLKRG